jgi:hypothetical protein
MSDLSNSIFNYYLEHSGEMEPDKQFHFASRLYLWSGEPACRDLLTGLRPWFTADGQPDEALRQVIAAAQASPVHGSKNAAELRLPYFQKYPRLKLYVSALFRVNFLLHVYGLDTRDEFLRAFPATEVEALATELLHDEDALAILSTHAVNFLYLYSRLFGREELFDPEVFLQVGENRYDLSERLHLQLFIYLYTHCIIGESLFYARRLSENPAYHTMFDRLEAVIEERFDDINLDNKFEFLVCGRLLGRENHLAEPIFAEAVKSVSPDGHYLIDVHNNHPQTDNVSLDKSEHRNVLFIMAHRAFEPGNSLV